MTDPRVEVICELQMPEQDHVYDHIRENAKIAKDMVKADGAGKRLIICGAGPSLGDLHQDLKQSFAHQVWACNSALPYLKDHHLPVTHGFAIDQGIEMMNPEEWERTFDVQYLIASSLHPKVIAHLRKANRRLKWFHNYIGLKDPDDWKPPENWKPPTAGCGYEMWMYQTLFPPAVQVGYGLNSVPRAICLALWMGFKSIRVYGADCAAKPNAPAMVNTNDPGYVPWLQSVQLYADGRSARHYGDTAVMVQTELCNDPTCHCRWVSTETGEMVHPAGSVVQRWHTRADMVISAVHLVDLAKAYPGRVVLVGNTLPNALMHKPQETIDGIPKLTGKGSISGFGVVDRNLTPPKE